MADKKTDEIFLFCGTSTGYETRVDPLPKCWLKMSNSQRATYKQKKKEEFFSLNKDKLINKNIIRY